MTARTTARRPASRRPAPRRKRKPKAPYRGVIFIPAVLAGPAGWAELGHLGVPAGRTGLLALSALSLLLVPVLMLALVTSPGQLAKAAIPRPWRAAWHHGRAHPRPSALLVALIHAADRDRCVACGVHQSQLTPAHLISFPGYPAPKKVLQLDHLFPYALGGLLILWNLFLLCPRCNVIKSFYWVDRHGKVTRPRGWTAAHEAEAAAILRRERRARFNLLRWWRIAWAL
jgi:hypothetical protein